MVVVVVAYPDGINSFDGALLGETIDGGDGRLKTAVKQEDRSIISLDVGGSFSDFMNPRWDLRSRQRRKHGNVVAGT